MSTDDGGGEDAGFAGLATVFGWLEKAVVWVAGLFSKEEK